MQKVACVEKSGNSQSSNSGIKILKMPSEIFSKKCSKSRSTISVKFSDTETSDTKYINTDTKIYTKQCMEKCGDYKTSSKCKCPKIKIKKKPSAIGVEKCGDTPSSSTRCKQIKNMEKCGDSQTHSSSSGTSLSARTKISFTSDTSDGKCTNSKSSISKISISRTSIRKSWKSKSLKSKSTISNCSDSTTDKQSFQETFKAKVTYLPHVMKSCGKDKSENQYNNVCHNSNATFGYQVDHSFWYRCPQCRREITYCPYDIDENSCFKCPQCCKDIKYFDGPCNVNNENSAETCVQRKRCNRKRKLKNTKEYEKRKIYNEFKEFCRQKCYHPEILECILLSSAYITAQNCVYNDLETNCGSSDGVPFSKQMPPHMGYCMYGSKLDDWFTHYLMRYLSREVWENDCAEMAWLNQLYEIIEEKYMMEDKKQRSKKLVWNRRMNSLSKLYNSTVGPTPSETCFNNHQISIEQNLYDNQTMS